jgi:hypothetical protein
VLVLLIGSGGLLGCSSRYQPEGQFWPNLDSVSVGGAVATAGTGDPTAGAQGSVAGSSNGGESAIDPGSGGSDNSFGGSDSTSGGGNSTSAGSSTGGRAGMGGGSSGGGGSGGAVTGSATCSLSVSVTTTAPGGNYKPRNVGAIWVADSSGAFVKSLEVWGSQRLSHVTAWNAATRAAGAAGNKVDAVTSATLSAHRTHSVTWNCLNYNRQAVPDGMYRVYFEVTDSNSSGPNHFESFAKGPMPVMAQSSSTNFNNISLMFKP